MIIILNGPINSGKTTVAKILWEIIPNTAHIEVDKIREFIDWMENEPAWNISFETSLSIAEEFIKKGLNVILTYHISDKDYNLTVKRLKKIDKDIIGFTFNPPLNKILVNRGSRDINEREKDRIKDTYKNKLYEVSYGESIDNSKQTPQETAQYIYDKVKKLLNRKAPHYPRREKSFYS